MSDWEQFFTELMQFITSNKMHKKTRLNEAGFLNISFGN
jgi:hypothetical protein